MYTTLAVAGYRSLRDVVVPLDAVTVVTGGNGTGKSSLYRALQLLASCGRGDVVGSLAREGGLASTLWAGPESLQGARRTGHVEGTVRTGPVSLRVGIAGQQFGYLMDLGIPQQSAHTAFNRDPEIKREAVWLGPVMRPSTMLARRKRGGAQIRDGSWTPAGRLATDESLLGLGALPDLRDLRDEFAGWRFHDALRVDRDAPARRPQVGTRTWALADDGADLAAALQTILESGQAPVAELVDDAFPGSQLAIAFDDAGVFDLRLTQPGMLRAMSAAELSDGTLRYLMLLAALHSPRPPALIALNEPERSLHPSLVEPLARLILAASESTQVVVVTHSAPLAEALKEGRDVSHVHLEKDLGETVVAEQGLLTRPAWEWGSR